MKGSFPRQRKVNISHVEIPPVMSKYLKITKEHDAFTSSNKFCVTLTLRCGEREEMALENSNGIQRWNQLSCHVMPRIKPFNNSRNIN